MGLTFPGTLSLSLIRSKCQQSPHTAVCVLQGGGAVLPGRCFPYPQIVPNSRQHVCSTSSACTRVPLELLPRKMSLCPSLLSLSYQCDLQHAPVAWCPCNPPALSHRRNGPGAEAGDSDPGLSHALFNFPLSYEHIHRRQAAALSAPSPAAHCFWLCTGEFCTHCGSPGTVPLFLHFTWSGQRSIL